MFGEDPKSTSGEDFFGVFNAFLNSFAESKGENIQMQKQKEEEERKARNLAQVEIGYLLTK